MITQSRLCAGLFATVIVFVSALALVKPSYSFDTVFYLGLMVANEDSNYESLHAKAYQIIQTQIPADKLHDLLSGNPYRTQLATNAADYVRMFPFYSVKPLYLMVAEEFARFLQPLLALTMVSIFSYIVIAGIIWNWLGKHISNSWRLSY